jgi:hypothetical protein
MTARQSAIWRRQTVFACRRQESGDESQWQSKFSRQVPVDLKTNTDFDEDWGRPGHECPPLRLPLRWMVV